MAEAAYDSMSTVERLQALSLDLLRYLGGCPAVSFQEKAVAACVGRRLGALGLSARADPYGNLIAHRPAHPDMGGDVPPIAFVAHMDHPGFEVVEASGDRLIARALGGVPQACFSPGVSLQIVLPDGRRLPAETTGAKGPPDERLVGLHPAEPVFLESPVAVVPDLPDFRLDGETIRMRALDDLAGCACVLATLELLNSGEPAGEVYGVFTRAEEVGLIGARLLAEAGVLPRETIVVSLEASRTLPGAAIGDGPVIRVGDASFTFDAEAESVLVRAREELTELGPNFKAQRQLMSGGTCEASAFRYHGYRTTGIAFPLGNYHNATPEGGIGAEYIHLEDFVGGVELAVQAALSVGRRRESRPWQRMVEVPQEYRDRLAGP